jgi:hypothetical protein
MKLGKLPNAPPISPPAGADIASRPVQAEDGADDTAPPEPGTLWREATTLSPANTEGEPVKEPEAAGASEAERSNLTRSGSTITELLAARDRRRSDEEAGASVSGSPAVADETAANAVPPSDTADNHVRLVAYSDVGPPSANTALPRPSPEDLDKWMQYNFRKGDKRDPTIKACCAATGARWRDALQAYQRVPQRLRRGRGGRDRPSGVNRASKSRK